MNKSTKKWYESKTLWLAVFTISAGIIVVLETNFPTLGWLVVVKGIIDVFLRFLTTSPIE